MLDRVLAEIGEGRGPGIVYSATRKGTRGDRRAARRPRPARPALPRGPQQGRPRGHPAGLDGRRAGRRRRHHRVRHGDRQARHPLRRPRRARRLRRQLLPGDRPRRPGRPARARRARLPAGGPRASGASSPPGRRRRRSSSRSPAWCRGGRGRDRGRRRRQGPPRGDRPGRHAADPRPEPARGGRRPSSWTRTAPPTRPTNAPSPAEAAAAARELAEHREKVDQSRVEMMRGYAETTRCRRQFLLGYFGEQLDEPCGNCDTCSDGSAQQQPEARRPTTTPFPAETPVEHSEWGAGVVMRVEEDRLVVLFDEVGYKTLGHRRRHRERTAPTPHARLNVRSAASRPFHRRIGPHDLPSAEPADGASRTPAGAPAPRQGRPVDRLRATRSGDSRFAAPPRGTSQLDRRALAENALVGGTP